MNSLCIARIFVFVCALGRNMMSLLFFFCSVLLWRAETKEDGSASICAKYFKEDLKQKCTQFCTTLNCQSNVSATNPQVCKNLELEIRPLLDVFNLENQAKFTIRTPGPLVSGTCNGYFYEEGKECDPTTVNLRDSPQWDNLVGYWAGNIIFLNGQGTVFESGSWNYPYVYKGFSVDNVVGNKIRRRTVFMWPPQDISKCPFPNSTGTRSGSRPLGTGICGVNGNTKAIGADQTATYCNTNLVLKGNLQGAVPPFLYSYSQLTGQNDTILTHLSLPKSAGFFQQERLLDAETTTLYKNPNTGKFIRVRSTQLFDGFANPGEPIGITFFRERKYDPAEFWTIFNNTITQYNIQDSDLCAWGPIPNGSTGPSGISGGYGPCKSFLEEALSLV